MMPPRLIFPCVVSALSLSCAPPSPPAYFFQGYPGAAPQAPVAPPSDPFVRIPLSAAPPPAWVSDEPRRAGDEGGMGIQHETRDRNETSYVVMSRYGLLLLSTQGGFRGLARLPEGASAAMLSGEGERVLVADKTGALSQAEDFAAALAGRFEPLSSVPNATVWDSRGSYVAAAGKDPKSGKWWLSVSRDGGKTFRRGPAPPGEVLRLAVRSDGVIAIELAGFDLRVARPGGVFQKLPIRAFPGNPEERSWLRETGVLRRTGDRIWSRFGCPEQVLDARAARFVDQDPEEEDLITGWPGEIVEPALRPAPEKADPEVDCGRAVSGILGALDTSLTPLAHAEGPIPSGPLPMRSVGDAACDPKSSHIEKETITVLGTAGEKSSKQTITHVLCNDDAPLKRWGTLALPQGDGLRFVRVPEGCRVSGVNSAIGLNLLLCRGDEGSYQIASVTGQGVHPETTVKGKDFLSFRVRSRAEDGTLIVSLRSDKEDAERFFLRMSTPPGEPARWRELAPGFPAVKALPSGMALLARVPGETPQNLSSLLEANGKRAPSSGILELSFDAGGGLIPLARIATTQNALDWDVAPDGRIRLLLHPRLTYKAQALRAGEAPPKHYWVGQGGNLVAAE